MNIESVLGHYRVEELLGVGAAAEVYRAHDLVSGQVVALKVLSERAEPAMVLRFTREAKALSRLNHPNIVRVYDAGLADDQRYLAMELAEGGSLKERLAGATIDWREAVDITRQLASALQQAHDANIIHRDIKPGNILFGGDGLPRLSDFGLAHLSDASSMTRTGTIMGTVYYLSPEQAVGKPVTPASDLYALGAVLYEMVVGQPPFIGPTAIAVIYKLLNEDHESIRSFNRDLPEALDALIGSLLNKNPELRPACASQVETDLAALLSGEAISVACLAPTTVHGEPLTAGVVPLVGRAAELFELAEAAGRAASGAGSTCMIVGEAGTGKTRLVRELLQQQTAQNARCLIGTCLYGDTPDPYSPFVGVVRQFAEFWYDRPRDLSDTREAEIQSFLEGLQSIWGMRQAVGTATANDWLAELAQARGQNQVFELFSRFLTAVSKLWPVLLVVDDLQWASLTTLQLFHYLARACQGQRILLIGTFRPEDVLPGIGGERHPLRETEQRMSREKLFRSIRLKPLSHQDAEEMAAYALNVDMIAPDLADLLVTECEGNPFYLLEMLSLLREQNVLIQQDGQWRLAGSVEDCDIPGSVYDIVMRRIERTGDDERDMLDWGSILGQRIDVSLLQHLVGGTRLTVMKRLHALEQRYGLIESDEHGFQFAHNKIREIIYQELPPALARECHLMVAQVIEQNYADELDDYTYQLARHYVEGGDVEHGFHYSCAAADRAEQAQAIAEASEYLASALRLLDQMPDENDPCTERDLAERLGGLYVILGKLDRALETYERALALSRTLQDGESEADVMLAVARLLGRSGKWDEAQAQARQSLYKAEETGYHKGRADALMSLGFMDFEGGDWQNALARLEIALAVTKEQKLEILQARVLGNLAIINNAHGNVEKAIELYKCSIETFAHLDKPLDVSRGLSNLGFSYYTLQDYGQALDCYQQSLSALGKIPDVHEQGVLYLHLAETYLALKQMHEARDNCRKAQRCFARLGFSPGIADVSRVYAGIARLDGKWNVAERYLREALQIYQEAGDQLNTAETHRELSDLLDEVGQFDSAKEELSRSRIIYNDLLQSDTAIGDVFNAPAETNPEDMAPAHQ